MSSTSLSVAIGVGETVDLAHRVAKPDWRVVPAGAVVEVDGRWRRTVARQVTKAMTFSDAPHNHASERAPPHPNIGRPVALVAGNDHRLVESRETLARVAVRQ